MFRDTIIALLDERPIPSREIIEAMCEASIAAAPEDLPTLVEISHMDDMWDFFLACPAIALMPAWGHDGISAICEIAADGPHPTDALSVLVAVALGRAPMRDDVNFLPKDWDRMPKYVLHPDTPGEALVSTREMVLDQLTDPIRKSMLLSHIAMQAMRERGNTTTGERMDFLMDALVDGHLVLNRRILGEFEALLEAGPRREEELQRFLAQHPVLLDPFVVELRNKHELGDDFITDFVVRRTNDDYVVVEIENSTDKLFTSSGSFTSDLSIAVGQVRDFQAWIADNIAYAQAKLPGIRHPEGLVVIGRRTDLVPMMEKRLSEENFSRRGHIKIVTYDDLLSQARAVYRNALERPVVLASRDQRTI